MLKHKSLQALSSVILTYFIQRSIAILIILFDTKKLGYVCINQQILRETGINHIARKNGHRETNALRKNRNLNAILTDRIKLHRLNAEVL